MGNINEYGLCNCDNNDSRNEESLKSNQNQEKMLCPFINTVIYQNYNLKNPDSNNNHSMNQIFDLKNNKNKHQNHDLNFEFHNSNSKNATNNKEPKKSSKKNILNISPNTPIDTPKNLNNFNLQEKIKNLNIEPTDIKNDGVIKEGNDEPVKMD